MHLNNVKSEIQISHIKDFCAFASNGLSHYSTHYSTLGINTDFMISSIRRDIGNDFSVSSQLVGISHKTIGLF